MLTLELLCDWKGWKKGRKPIRYFLLWTIWTHSALGANSQPPVQKPGLCCHPFHNSIQGIPDGWWGWASEQIKGLVIIILWQLTIPKLVARAGPGRNNYPTSSNCTYAAAVCVTPVSDPIGWWSACLKQDQLISWSFEWIWIFSCKKKIVFDILIRGIRIINHTHVLTSTPHECRLGLCLTNLTIIFYHKLFYRPFICDSTSYKTVF